MSKLKSNLFAIAFILPVLFVGTSCGDDDDDNGWTDAEVEAFVTECVDDENGTKEQCQCFVNKLTGEFSKSEFEASDDLSIEDTIKILEYSVDCEITLSLE